jgi:hypothetical protein
MFGVRYWSKPGNRLRTWPLVTQTLLVLMTKVAISLEDDRFVWATAQTELRDDNMASDYAMQFAALLFVSMQAQAPDWSSCRIRIAAPNGVDLLVSSAAEAALLERDRVRVEARVRTDH